MRTDCWAAPLGEGFGFVTCGYTKQDGPYLQGPGPETHLQAEEGGWAIGSQTVACSAHSPWPACTFQNE